MARWGDEKTLLFITYYREYDCLWNSSSPLYKNKIARENAYKSLLQQINDDNLTVKLIKTKIKNLRTTYHQELNKIKESKRSGADSSQVYKPSIRWFEEMHSFLGTIQHRPTISSEIQADELLNAVCVPREASSELTLPRSTNISQNKLPLPTSQPDIQASRSGQTSRGDPVSAMNNLELNQPVHNDQEPTARKQTKLATKITLPTKKRKHEETNSEISNALKRLEDISTIINHPRTREDEFYFFGMNVAAQLRKLPLHIALQLQGEFQNTLYLARVRDQLSNNSTLANTNSRSGADTSPQINDQFRANETSPQNVKIELSPS